jgi:hypothetical protein
MRDLSALAKLTLASVPTSADRIGSSSPRKFAEVSVSLVESSS